MVDPMPTNFRPLYTAALTLMLGVMAGLTPWHAPPAEAETRPIVFPVEGDVRFSNDFGAPRAGHRHQGNDLLGTKLQKVLATRDGTITRVKVPGNYLELTDDEGWRYIYIHLNNDSPGTDDGRAPLEWVLGPGVAQGVRVRAGQHIGYLGDSGNAEHTQPHIHFEMHRPGGGVVNPYDSLVAADRTSPAVAVAGHPSGGHYVLTGNGTVTGHAGAPDFGSASVPGGLARAMAVTPDGQGYVVLDALGGLHKLGSATTGPLGSLGAPSLPGDIARSVAVTPSGRGYVVLDAYGGVHAYGDAPTSDNHAYWPGQDIARNVAVTRSGRGLFVLDGFGGVHPSGDAPALTSPWWPGNDVARAIVVTPSGAGYGVLTTDGAVHPAGDARSVAATGGSWRSISRDSSGAFLLLNDDGAVATR